MCIFFSYEHPSVSANLKEVMFDEIYITLVIKKTKDGRTLLGITIGCNSVASTGT